MDPKLTWREARELLLERVRRTETERLPLSEAAGRVLAEPVSAVRDVPPFDRSPFDGYTFRSGDTRDALPVTLTILEEVPAGSVPTKAVTPGTATKILTGAPIPEGADAVTKYEETEFTPERVTLKRSYRPGENIIRRGEDVALGEVLGRTGQHLDAGLLGTLASQGIPAVEVYRRPVVGIITTGSELVEVEAAAQPGKIPNSNRYALEAAVLAAGCLPRYYASPVDSVEEIAAVVAKALAETDLVITTGGVSVGDYDLTPKAYEAAGVEVFAGDLLLKPGGKSCFGCKENKLVIGLSGNPASAMTCFYAVALPALRKLRGDADGRLPELTVRLGRDYKRPSPQPRLLRGTVQMEPEGLTFYPADKQGNGSLQTLAGANALAEIPAKSGPLEAGTRVAAFYFGSTRDGR